MPIKIKDDKGYLRTVGYLRLGKKGRVFFKPVTRMKNGRPYHYLKVVKGYGIQKEVFDKYLRGRKGRIIIKEKDTGRFLVASIKTWTEHSSTANFGAGKQVFLSERFMHGSENFDRSVIKEGK